MRCQIKIVSLKVRFMVPTDVLNTPGHVLLTRLREQIFRSFFTEISMILYFEKVKKIGRESVGQLYKTNKQTKNVKLYRLTSGSYHGFWGRDGETCEIQCRVTDDLRTRIVGNDVTRDRSIPLREKGYPTDRVGCHLRIKGHLMLVPWSGVTYGLSPTRFASGGGSIDILRNHDVRDPSLPTVV